MSQRLSVTRRLLRLGSMLSILLVTVTGTLVADTVFHYTNVTMNPGHYLIPEGTLGAPVIASNGSVGLGQGGCPGAPFDDCWGGGSTPVGNANAFDRYWSQIYFAGGGYLTFDLGAPMSQVYIALSQDHGPYPPEALEYRVWVSNDNSTFTELGATTPITMFVGGWSTAGEPGGDVNGNGVLNDDYSALWNLGGNYRYVRLTAVQAGGGFDEPEIDAVIGVVPEPGTMLLLGLGAGLLGWPRRRRA